MYVYVPYVTPHVCAFSRTWWDNAIYADGCLLNFSVYVRVLWLSVSQRDWGEVVVICSLTRPSGRTGFVNQIASHSFVHV